MSVPKIDIYVMKKLSCCIYTFLLLVLLVCNHGRGIAQERQSSNIVQIMAVMSADYPQYREAFEGFKNALDQENIKYNIELVESIGNNNFDVRIIDRIRQLNTDLVLAIGTRAATNLCMHIQDIPIVFSMVLNHQFNNSTHDKNENITGVTISIPVITQFDIYKEVVPNLRNIGVIYSIDENSALIEEADAAAKNLNINLVQGAVNNEREVPQTLQNLIRVVDMIWMIVDNAVNNQKSRENIILEGFRNNIPVMGLAENLVQAGVTLAVSADYRNVGFQSGTLAKKILQGTAPSQLTYEHPEDIILYVNERITSGIGLKIPESIYQRVKVVYR